MTSEHRKGIEGAATTNVVLAAAVFLAPFFTGADMVLLTSNMVTGVLLAALAGYNIYAASQRHTERAYAPAVVNVVLGLWVLVSGFFVPTNLALTVTNAILGAAVAILATYNTWAANDARQHAVPVTPRPGA